ncbi:MAG: aldehyde dehydrogenase family protein [Thermomicrobiales bacterium]
MIAGAPRTSAVCSKEAFAPLVNVFPVASFEAGIEGLNDSSFGLQAGVFTNNLEHGFRAFEATGGVIINIPTTGSITCRTVASAIGTRSRGHQILHRRHDRTA